MSNFSGNVSGMIMGKLGVKAREIGMLKSY